MKGLILQGRHTGVESKWVGINDNYTGNIHSPTNSTTFVETGNISGYTSFILISTDGPCLNKDTVQVFVKSDILVPNVFTANGDGIGETFKIKGIETHSGAHVYIYNRWGSLVYETQNYASNEWTGALVPEGVYYYVIELDSDKNLTKTGVVHLIR